MRCGDLLVVLLEVRVDLVFVRASLPEVRDILDRFASVFGVTFAQRVDERVVADLREYHVEQIAVCVGACGYINR